MSDELPPPPPGITLMSLQDFLDRRAAPAETPRTDAKRANPDGFSYDEAIAWAEQLERELALALDHIEKDDKEIERLHNEIAALRSKK